MRRDTLCVFCLLWSLVGHAQSIVDPRFTVDTIILDTPQNRIPLPIAIEFLSPDNPNRFFLLEKHTGRVKLVENGVVRRTVLDLPVNASDWESGLLYITLHPDFASNGYVYIFYSHDRTGTDSTSNTNWSDNRLVRYRWNGTALVEPQTILSIPNDPAFSLTRLIHNGGVMFFGPDGKLWLVVGELNRSNGIETNQHPTQVIDGGGIIRINDDGTIPNDNPFISHSDPRIRRLWAYGIRNSFGMAVDSLTNRLWITENGPNRYDEINYVRRGFNSAWRRWTGPLARNSGANLNQLVQLPNSYYDDPRFSWLQPIGVVSILFLRSARFPADLRDQAIVSESVNNRLYLFRMNAARDDFDFSAFPQLQDRVADNADERNLLTWGTNWHIVSDLKIGPDGYLYVVTHIGSSSVPVGVRRIRPVNPPEILNGKAKLEGRNGLPLGVPLTLRLYNDHTLVQTITTALDAYGKFSEKVNAPGTYTIKAKAGSYLSVTVPNVAIAPQGFAYRELVFTINGDVNGDDVINDADLLAVLLAFGSAGGVADVNNDGTVDDADLLTVLLNFGRS
ncbi:MAG: PQQ-dependent sugar dehydrogenase [Fimbriimonadales bacterium]|nr:PQQ-dependent sugar dehydrogenase [Fimbriimonadales bacterium]